MESNAQKVARLILENGDDDIGHFLIEVADEFSKLDRHFVAELLIQAGVQYNRA